MSHRLCPTCTRPVPSLPSRPAFCPAVCRRAPQHALKLVLSHFVGDGEPPPAHVTREQIIPAMKSVDRTHHLSNCTARDRRAGSRVQIASRSSFGRRIPHQTARMVPVASCAPCLGANQSDAASSPHRCRPSTSRPLDGHRVCRTWALSRVQQPTLPCRLVRVIGPAVAPNSPAVVAGVLTVRMRRGWRAVGLWAVRVVAPADIGRRTPNESRRSRTS